MSGDSVAKRRKGSHIAALIHSIDMIVMSMITVTIVIIVTSVGVMRSMDVMSVVRAVARLLQLWAHVAVTAAVMNVIMVLIHRGMGLILVIVQHDAVLIVIVGVVPIRAIVIGIVVVIIVTTEMSMSMSMSVTSIMTVIIQMCRTHVARAISITAHTAITWVDVIRIRKCILCRLIVHVIMNVMVVAMAVATGVGAALIIMIRVRSMLIELLTMRIVLRGVTVQ